MDKPPHILLINPWVHDFTAFDLWAKPLGLLYIASTLRQFGYEVHLIDCLQYSVQPEDHPHPSLPPRGGGDCRPEAYLPSPSLEGRGKGEGGHPRNVPVSHRQRPYGTGSFYSKEIEKPSVFRDIPRRFKRYGMPPEVFQSKLNEVGARVRLRRMPLLVGVTSHMTYWYPGVFEAVRLVKSVFPSVPVALGGIYASLCYEHAREHSGADYVIKGPGDLEVLRLADKLCGRGRDYSQVVAQQGEGGSLRAKRSNSNEIASSAVGGLAMTGEGAFPAYDLYMAEQYGRADGSPLRSVSMLTSRGCPFRCTYCASSLLGPMFVRRDPEKVVVEIEYYVNTLGVKDVAFYDDALFVDSGAHIIPILELLIKRGLQARFHTPNGLHPRYIDLPLARLLRRAGFRTLRLGFEGTSADMQRASSYKVNNQELERAVGCLRQAGYSARDIGVYLLVGLPGQGVEEVVEAMRFVNGLGARIKLAEYSPIPGTEGFNRASTLCPQVVHEPLCHNKSTFAPLGMGIDYKTFEGLKLLARRLNTELDVVRQPALPL